MSEDAMSHEPVEARADNDMLDTRAVAEMMNIKPETVRWYHKNGIMPKADFRFGNALVWKRSTIEEWMLSQ